MEFSLVRQRFYQTIQQTDDTLDLALAALYIAQEEYSHLDPEAYLNALDTMATELQERLPAEPYPLKIIQSMNQYLHQDLGFVGNQSDYYDPRNSFLNEVIERRTGIPITLSLVYLEVARRINFPMAGVGMPGHFLIRPTIADMEIFVDPFRGGEILFIEDCQARLAQMYGAEVEFQPQFLETVSPRQILARLLTNLKLIYLQRGDVHRAIAATERILLLFPQIVSELRDRGLLYYKAERFAEARHDLETYLEAVPQSDDTPVIEQVLEQIRQNLS